MRLPAMSTLTYTVLPSTTLFRSQPTFAFLRAPALRQGAAIARRITCFPDRQAEGVDAHLAVGADRIAFGRQQGSHRRLVVGHGFRHHTLLIGRACEDRKSTRLNSSH